MPHIRMNLDIMADDDGVSCVASGVNTCQYLALNGLEGPVCTLFPRSIQPVEGSQLSSWVEHKPLLNHNGKLVRELMCIKFQTLYQIKETMSNMILKVEPLKNGGAK